MPSTIEENIEETVNLFNQKYIFHGRWINLKYTKRKYSVLEAQGIFLNYLKKSLFFEAVNNTQEVKNVFTKHDLFSENIRFVMEYDKLLTIEFIHFNGFNYKNNSFIRVLNKLRKTKDIYELKLNSLLSGIKDFKF